MAYREEYTNTSINVLCSNVYNTLKERNQLISTDFYIVEDDEGDSKLSSEYMIFVTDSNISVKYGIVIDSKKVL